MKTCGAPIWNPWLFKQVTSGHQTGCCQGEAQGDGTPAPLGQIGQLAKVGPSLQSRKLMGGPTGCVEGNHHLDAPLPPIVCS